MKLDKAMKDYYCREIERQYLPGQLPDAADGTVAHHAPEHQLSSFWLNVIFNAAAAALVTIALLFHGTYRNPLIDELEIVNKKYNIDTNFIRGLESLPGCLKQHK